MALKVWKIQATNEVDGWAERLLKPDQEGAASSLLQVQLASRQVRSNNASARRPGRARMSEATLDGRCGRPGIPPSWDLPRRPRWEMRGETQTPFAGG